jgi:hypothetical protein
MRFTKGKLYLVLVAGLALPMSATRVLADDSDHRGPKLIHSEAVAKATITGAAFGPVGPNCDVAAGGSACAFIDVAVTAVGQNEPLGKYTGVLGATLLLNPAYFIPSGAHDAAGNPTGICTPEFGTETDTFSDGSTLSLNFQGLGCCGGPDCSAGLGTGPPSVNTIPA